MGSSAHLLFPLPIQWSSALWSILFTLIGFSMMFWGGYLVIESFCKILIGIMGGSLLIAALLSRPDPAAIITGMVFPHLPYAHGLYSTTLIIMALIGTEVGSTANLTYAYFIQEKGWRGLERAGEGWRGQKGPALLHSPRRAARRRRVAVDRGPGWAGEAPAALHLAHLAQRAEP